MAKAEDILEKMKWIPLVRIERTENDSMPFKDTDKERIVKTERLISVRGDIGVELTPELMAGLLREVLKIP